MEIWPSSPAACSSPITGVSESRIAEPMPLSMRTKSIFGPALAKETFGEHGCGGVVADVYFKSEMFGDWRGQVEIVPAAHRGGADHAVVYHAGGGDSRCR